ncbi:MAG: type II toxin-antitoxin system HicB family antitoxin [Caldilineae bacterium]|nr:MAG: type II toxin-antitoxin system HicB family antitoxin [Caldilineae bacterium]
MARYVVYVEVNDETLADGGPLAHVPALPGATARGKTVQEAVENLRAALTDYLRLLRDAGEDVPRAGEGLELKVEETKSDTLVTDYDHINAPEVEKLIEWLSLSRQELVNTLKGLPPEAWDWKPDGESWTLADIVNHIANADLYYTDRLTPWPEAPLLRLAATRGVALERLRSLSDEERNRVIVFNKSRWTARKVIRRMLEHEREHLTQIRELIARFRDRQG